MSEAPAARRAGRPAVPLSRSEILLAARRVFAVEGYSGATLDAIAGSLGIQKASLLYHFGSKEVLYTEAVLELFGELKRTVIGSLGAEADGPGGFAERLDQLCDSVTRFLHRNPEAAALIVHELARPPGDRPGTGRVADTLRTIVTLLQGGLEASPGSPDPGHLFLSIMGVNLLYFAAPSASSAVVGGDIFAPEREAQRAAEVRMHVRALCGLPRGPAPESFSPPPSTRQSP